MLKERSSEIFNAREGQQKDVKFKMLETGGFDFGCEEFARGGDSLRIFLFKVVFNVTAV